MSSFSRGAVLCVLLLMTALACSQQQASSPSGPRVTLPGSEVKAMKSASTGREYDLYIHLPSDYGKNPGQKYPALYILDGQWDFKLMDALLGGLVYDRFVPNMIMVGITYSGENADYVNLRAMDLTPTHRDDVAGSGGAPKFLNFIKTEVIPFVEKNYRADPSKRVLQGSSYAGLFTLYTLFSDPGLFSAYVAASPAVDYDDSWMVKQEAEFAKTHKQLPVRLFIGVGGSEDLTGPVKEFMQIVQSRKYGKLKLHTHVAEGERHASNKPELFNRGLRFVFE